MVPGMTHLDDLNRRQLGVLTRSQALEAGLTLDGLRHRLESGRWQRLSPGTYATFTGPVPGAALRWAAVLSAGAGAVLSHRSAAEEAGLVEPEPGPIHVTIPVERRVRPSAGMIVHRSRHVAARRHPLRLPPQTRIEETVLDLASEALTDDAAMAWIAAACARRLTTPERVARALDRRTRIRRRADLSVLIGGSRAGCTSVLEWRYLRDVERAHGLPVAVRQRRRPRDAGNWYDDVHYADHGVLVELDGRAAHPDGRRWRDFRRDNAAVVGEGDVVLRFGAADIRRRPCEVALQVAEVLWRGGWNGIAKPCRPGCAAAAETVVAV